ncbi:MAG: hypothetical protein U0637_10390 [Phycisphaerales bacterium]
MWGIFWLIVGALAACAVFSFVGALALQAAVRWVARADIEPNAAYATSFYASVASVAIPMVLGFAFSRVVVEDEGFARLLQAMSVLLAFVVSAAIIMRRHGLGMLRAMGVTLVIQLIWTGVLLVLWGVWEGGWWLLVRVGALPPPQG